MPDWRRDSKKRCAVSASGGRRRGDFVASAREDRDGKRFFTSSTSSPVAINAGFGSRGRTATAASQGFTTRSDRRSTTGVPRTQGCGLSLDMAPWSYHVLGLRFANRVFEQLWNRDHVEQVEIVWEESLTLEGRASYYGRVGVLKDMIQNHLLQLLCLVGMEAPLTLDERTLRDRKIDVLRAVRRLFPEEVERYTVRARYTAGAYRRASGPNLRGRGRDRPGSRHRNLCSGHTVGGQLAVGRRSFKLRSGKALGRERREIAVHFRPVPHLAFEANDPLPNVVRLLLEPDRLVFGTNLNRPGFLFPLERIELSADFTSQKLPGYARPLLMVLDGDCTLSIRDDEAEESRRAITPILNVWAQGRVPLLEYPAGSDGPTTALA
jgi:glucose-6-phosphate 1-dehydrogenase